MRLPEAIAIMQKCSEHGSQLACTVDQVSASYP